MTITRNTLLAATTLAAAVAIASPASAAINDLGASGEGTAAAVAAFRAELGGGATAKANGPDTTSGLGRREINWDGVPDAFATPNLLPPDFFNKNAARGVVLRSANADRFLVSANAASTVPVRFGDQGLRYTDEFATFSAQRLFAPVGTNEFDIDFKLPGTQTPAVVTGFGAVFTDVDLPGETVLSAYDAQNALIGHYAVPASGGSGQLSFEGITDNLGVARIARVHVKLGSAVLGTLQAGGNDVVVMDDFLFGEPLPITPPAPPTTPADPPVVTVPQPEPQLPQSEPATVPAKVTTLKVTGRTVKYVLTAPAPTRIVIERRTKSGKYKTVKVVKRSAAVGTQSVKLPAPGVGRYRVTVKVYDASGKTVASKVRLLKVSDSPAKATRSSIEKIDRR